MVERPHRQVHRLEAAKRPLHLRQVLVGADRLRCVEPLRLDVGADDVDPVELFLGRDLLFVAVKREALVGDVGQEVLGHRESPLDGGLPLDQAGQGRIQLVRVDFAEPEHLAQGGHRALGGQAAGGGQLRRRVNDAGDDQGEHEVAEAAGAPGEQRVQPELLEGGCPGRCWI